MGHPVPLFRAICGAGGLSVRLSQIPDEGLVLQRGKAPLVFAVVEFFKPPPEVGVQLHPPPQLPDRASRRAVGEIPASQVCHIDCIHTVSVFESKKITPQQPSFYCGERSGLLRSGRYMETSDFRPVHFRALLFRHFPEFQSRDVKCLPDGDSRTELDVRFADE